MVKLRMVIVLMIISIIIVNINISFTYAFSPSDCWGSLPGEIHSSGGTGTGGDGNKTTIETIDEYVHQEYYNEIRGNVYDEGIINKNGKYAEEKDKYPGVEDVTVKLLNEDGSYTGHSVRTDENGNYSFSGLNIGSYKVQFQVGSIEKIDQKDKTKIKNVLKYNGLDYQVSRLPNSEGTNTSYSVTEKEIITMGKNAIQVMLLLDCSNSTRWTKVRMYDGTEKTRLEVEVEATKKLIERLLNADEGIYITLIFFDGNNHYRALKYGLSRNQGDMYYALDHAKDVLPYGGTDIESALNVAKGSFVYENKENTNRVVALVTDGMPSGCCDEKIRSSDNDATIDIKLKKIEEATRNKLKELKDDGIKVMSLVVNSEDEEEQEYINNIFNDDTTNLHLNINDGDKMADAIEKELNKTITSEFHTEEIKEVIRWKIEYGSDEDRQRYIDIVSKFRQFKWNNTSRFKVLDDYDGTDKSYKRAIELSNDTYFTVTSKGTYTIEEKPSEWTETKKDPETGKVIKRIHYVAEAKSYTVDLGLVKKTEAQLNLEQYISALRVTLANGQEAYFKTRDNNNKDQPLICELDDELARGANAEIEYTIKITSPTSMSYKEIKLIDYLPEGFMYDENQKLLTEDGTNSKYWDKIIIFDDENSNDEYFNNSEETKKIREKYSKQINVMSKGISIGNEGETNIGTLKFVVSKRISNLYNSENISKENEAEVYSYETYNPTATIPETDFENGTPRRMTANISTSLLASQINPVDTKDLGSLISLYAGSFDGLDFIRKTTNTVAVVPPTGNVNNFKNLIMLAIAIVGLTVGIIIKIKIKKNK